MSYLPLVSLENEHKSQGQAHGSQGHEQHTHPVVPQGEHLAGGVDVGPYHHVEHLQEARERAPSATPVLKRSCSIPRDTLWPLLTPSMDARAHKPSQRLMGAGDWGGL